MPTYQYRCQTCQGEFEVRQSFTDDALSTCIDDACDGPVNKVFSGVGISFKGDGFYKNDHGSAARGRSTEKTTADTSASGSTESGSDTRTTSEGSSATGTTPSSTDSASNGSTSDKASSPAPKASSTV